MADPILKQREDLLDINVDIVKALRDEVKEQEKGNALLQKRFNLTEQLTEVIKSRQLTQQQQLVLLEEALVKKTERYVQLEGKRLGGKQIETQRRLGAEIRSIQAAHAKISEEMARQYNFAKSLEKTHLDKIYNEIKEIGNILAHHPIYFVGVASAYIWGSVLATFRKLDKSAEEFRRTIGATRTYTDSIRAQAEDISREFLAVGVGVDHVYAAFVAIAKTLGSTQYLTNATAKDMTLLSAQLGISEKTSAEFLRTLGMVGQTTIDAQRNMTLFTTKMTEAAGVPLDDVMLDVAQSSKASYAFLTKSSLELVKAAVEAKRLGTSLASSTTSSKGLLQFTKSVKDEMTASVLLGESINLQHARELAYRRDLKGLNQEILKIAKQANFEQLDPFQQEAVADALGKSADELGQMLQADRERASIERAIANDGTLRKQRDALNQMLSASKGIAESEGERARKQLQTEANQARITSVTNSWHRIMLNVAKTFLPIIDGFLKFIANTLDKINGKTAQWVGGTIAVVGTVITLVSVFSRLFGKSLLGGIGKGVGQAFEGTFTGIARGAKAMGSAGVFRGVLAILALSASLIPLALAFKIMQGVSWKTFFVAAAAITALAIGAAILAPLFAPMLVGAGVIAALGASLIPLAAALWLASKAMTNFGGGFKNIVDSLEKLSGLNFIQTILQLKDLTAVIRELSVLINAVPDIKVERLENIAMKNVGTAQLQTPPPDNKALIDEMESVRMEVAGLRKDLSSGGINANVYIDSQKLDSAVGRRLLFTGPLAPA